MKNLIRKIFLLTVIAVGLSSCTKDSIDPTATDSGDFTLSSPTDGSFVLNAATAGDEIFVAKWTSADYGYAAAVNYQLQLVKSTDAFAATDNPAFDLGNYGSSAGKSFEKSVTTRQLNTLILAANPGGVGVNETYKIRIVAKVNNQLDDSTNNLNDAFSQVATISVTAYDAFDEFDRIYVPGNYGGASTYADWNPDNAPKLFSKANDGKYEGFVWMNNVTPAFKFTEDNTWGNDKGDATDPNGFTDIAHSGHDIKPTDGDGTYFFTVDWNLNKYTIGKRQVAMIGQATPNGWGAPTYLTFDTNPASPYFRMYTLDISLIADEFLIRLKDDWSEKMGTVSGSPSGAETVPATSPYKIKIGGGNMKVPAAGNYKVVLDIRNSANYNLRLIPN
jgi:hypothetical protein